MAMVENCHFVKIDVYVLMIFQITQGDFIFRSSDDVVVLCLYLDASRVLRVVMEVEEGLLNGIQVTGLNVAYDRDSFLPFLHSFF